MNSLGVKKKKKEDRNLKKYLIVFFISMVPLIELRGAIPYAVSFQLPLLPSYIVAIIGNMLPVPIIYFFANKVPDHHQHKEPLPHQTPDQEVLAATGFESFPHMRG